MGWNKRRQSKWSGVREEQIIVPHTQHAKAQTRVKTCRITFNSVLKEQSLLLTAMILFFGTLKHFFLQFSLRKKELQARQKLPPQCMHWNDAVFLVLRPNGFCEKWEEVEFKGQWGLDWPWARGARKQSRARVISVYRHFVWSAFLVSPLLYLLDGQQLQKTFQTLANITF